MTAVTWLAGPDAWRTRGRDPMPHELGGGTVPDPDPDPPVDPPSNDYGTPSARPPIALRPSAADTGNLTSTTTTMSGSEALAARFTGARGESGRASY